jgi:frataxin
MVLPATVAGLNRHGMRMLRFFQTESDFHSAADATLLGIQDAVEEALEEKGVPEFEVTFASGVLNLVFPPHGTWVINKQTPNRQLWWSSPISGPRRYEYEDGEWVFTRDDSHSMTLEQALKDELEQIYNVNVDL